MRCSSSERFLLEAVQGKRQLRALFRVARIHGSLDRLLTLSVLVLRQADEDTVFEQFYEDSYNKKIYNNPLVRMMNVSREAAALQLFLHTYCNSLLKSRAVSGRFRFCHMLQLMYFSIFFCAVVQRLVICHSCQTSC